MIKPPGYCKAEGAPAPYGVIIMGAIMGMPNGWEGLSVVSEVSCTPIKADSDVGTSSPDGARTCGPYANETGLYGYSGYGDCLIGI